MSVFLDLAPYDEYAVDTETKGSGRNVIPVGVSLVTPDGQKRYMRWGHEAGGNNCTLPEFKAWAKRELGRRDQACIMFNAPYDIRSLANIGVEVKSVIEDVNILCALLNEFEPRYSLDHLSTTYLGLSKSDEALNQICAERFGGQPTRKAQAQNYWRVEGHFVADYAEDDAALTLALYRKRYWDIIEQDLLEVYRLETMLIPVLHRMYMAGVRIDVRKAEAIQTKLQTEFDQINREWQKLSGGIKFSERKRLVEFLETKLGLKLPRTKPSQTFPDGQASVKKEVLENLDHPVGRMIRRMRQLDHYGNTFIQSYLLDNVDDFGFIFPEFHQVQRSTFEDPNATTGTISGRFSSSGDLNAQNIPARDEELAPLVRSMFIPMNEDSQWLRCDYSQIEYRFFAHYAGGQMRQAYLDNPDIDFHQWVMDLTGLKRKQAKNVNFAKLYGAGVPKMAFTMGASLEEAQEIVDIYDAKIPEAKSMYYKAMNRASARKYIITWGGRRLRFQWLKNSKTGGMFLDKTYTALNKLLQGSSADLTKNAMIEVDQAIDWETTKMHLTVHDELDFSVPKGSEGLKQAKMIREIMENFELTVPIRVEAELGSDWGHTELVPRAA